MVSRMAPRPLPFILTALVLSAGLAACSPPQARAHREHARRMHPTALRTVERLTCPDRQGSLRRVSAAADGRSCEYEGNNGSRVVMRILPLDGASAETALAPVEAEL